VSAQTKPGVIEPRLSHAALLTAAQLLRGVLRLCFVIALARVLGPGQFGVYALLLAMVEMLAVASGTGYIDYLTREAAKDERLGWGLAGQLIWLRLACFVPCTGIGLSILWLLGYPRLVLTATAFMALTLLPRSLSEAVQGVLRGVGRYVEFFVVELVLGLTLATGAGFLLARGGGLRGAIAVEVAAAVTAAGAGLVFALKLRTKQRRQLDVRQLIKTGAIFNIYVFVGNLYDRLDVVLLSKLAGDFATGIYGAAYRAIGMVQLLPYGVLYSLLPTLSRGDAAEAGQREKLEKAMGLLLSAAFAIVLATMVYADALVPRLLGAGFAESAAALKILIWAVILRYVNHAMNMRLLASGHEKVFVSTSAVCLAVNLFGNLVFIPMFSWRAAAVLTIVTEMVLLSQNVYWLRRITGGVPRPLRWARVSLAFVAALLGILAGGRLVSPLLVGTACLAVFFVYLYRIGMVGEFASIWRMEPGSPSLPPVMSPNSHYSRIETADIR
jgi:O-antigen/teichoic acid export membrane protein